MASLVTLAMARDYGKASEIVKQFLVFLLARSKWLP